ncbi:bifunctional hydroxymethylpyrimidine kinase/phosphomethylpyrimidine kinase [Paenibacillus selenitireducens]|uniref:Hydroxymethylpyrimidine/phosphomethylpyrimidine kinase n=1 Tax=Paenibacillus selenitireducens TaxID=1324314 RepID=A0A1T2XNK5_9BACL|nr:bifunctional hydroxymethylpyrimidine kinase/phosphomethylpyrimidine kinase [Paenibacillus selenitireducens]OPA81263.1 bifunctional hydroxymethylpyrimidine kinase/phosphomethylpyrimidine kinase [Paenibacillus selenitireducens]
MLLGRALTIAGSDSGGGAGIQADLKTFQELHAYGMSAITAVTAQNTLGVQGVYPMSVEAVVQQIDAVGQDIGVDALKTGMLFSAEIIEAVADRIQHYGWRNVVVDPVMIAKGGAALLQTAAIQALKEYLIPLAWVITPNIPEAEALTGIKIGSMDQRKEACKRLIDLGAHHVIVKGGHEEGSTKVVDLLYDGEAFTEVETLRIETRHTHGTGCTFAAAITAELAKGKDLSDALSVAKEFIQAAISHPLGIGAGHGPTNHWAYRGLIPS